MARRRNGRDLNGWLIVDKPAGMTSTSLVNQVRRAYGAKKAGHAGTLDPAATGLLAVACGEATKTVPYVADALKTYEFDVCWGAATNTDDAEGEVIARSDLRPTVGEITAALPEFTGEIMQVPPQFSAVKINGERAYARARAGESSEIAARPLWVERLELVSTTRDQARLVMECGKGGYVRSIARDLGARLGCLGHVLGLRRTESGPFTLEDAVSFDQALEGDDARLLPLEVGLAGLPEQRVPAEAAMRLRQGNPGAVAATALAFGDECWASCQGQPVAIGVYKAGYVHPTRVFVLGPSPSAR